jgi:signal transduction histidine kinase
LEAKTVIQENRLKLSKKVHDVVANGLYRVMSEIENQDDLDKDGVLDKIEVLYDKSRDISYEDNPVVEPNFKDKVNALLTSFSSQSTRVSLVGNEEALWNQVSPKAINDIEHVLQELMVNMKKHSNAANVVVKFEQVGNFVNIYYIDDGIGIKGELNFNNGLTSTGNRIAGIGGTITFDRTTDKGLKIHITFPIS